MEKGISTLRELYVLQKLATARRITISDLAVHKLVSTASLTDIVEKMVKAGYIARERDTEDRRRVYVELTPEGKKLL